MFSFCLNFSHSNSKLTSNYVRTAVVIAINFHIVPCYGGKHEQRGPHAHNCHNGQLRHVEPMDLLSSRHLLNTNREPKKKRNVFNGNPKLNRGKLT